MIKIPFLSGKKNFSKNKIKPTVLLVLDGFGKAPPSKGNAITLAETPNFDRFTAQFPNGELIASGESVGLPANEAGNSEVGHLTIGAGRVVYQSLPRINMAIKEGNFYFNKAFLSALNHAKINNSNLHIMGLVSSGTVHSSNEHLYALLEFCKKNKFKRVYLHLFTDGRDAPPQDGISVIEEITKKLETLKLGRICTISGRYYAMDRDGRWERTQKAYEAIVAGKGKLSNDPIQAVKESYSSGKTDEFIEPTVIVDSNSKPCVVKDNDAVIFFNFRIDRPRQLTMAFVMPDFENLKTVEFGYMPHEGTLKGQEKVGPTFKRIKKLKNLFFVTMTEYQKDLSVGAVAFPPPVVKETIPEVLSNLGYKHLHLAESEKERMVTFYFDGMREEKFKGEDDVIIPSPDVATYDKRPEMSVYKLAKEFKKQLAKDKYHFFVINFANPDMVAHSGSLPAAVDAIKHVDKATGEIAEAINQAGGTLFITADHGNAEELLTFPSTSFFITTSEGKVNTEHSNNPVPFYIIGNNFKNNPLKLPPGTLSDVAPTILATMNIKKPQGMQGRDLLTEAQKNRNTQKNFEEDAQSISEHKESIQSITETN